jgi:hypothetical protein
MQQGNAGVTLALVPAVSRKPVTGQTPGAKAASSDLQHYGKQ